MRLSPDVPSNSVRLFRPDVDQLGLDPLLRKMREDQPQLPGFDETLHRLVALDNDQIVGYADIWKPPGSECAELTVTWDHASKSTVDPALVTESVLNATAQGASSLLIYVGPAEEHLARLLVQHGFEQGSGYRQLSLQLTLEPAEPTWPTGFELRSFEELADRGLLIDASENCYAGLWGHKPADEQAVDLLLASFPHDGVLMLTDSSKEIVGICKATTAPSVKDRYDEPTGYLDGPGLVTPLRHRLELYAEMTRAGLKWLYGTGHRQVILETWGDPDNVLQVYTGMGFKIEVDIPAYLLRIDGEALGLLR